MVGWHRGKRALAAGIALAMLGFVMPVAALEQGQLFVTQEEGYARLILSFPGKDALPKYTMRIENGILSLVFEEQVSVALPDVGTILPDYFSVARIDPDNRGIRLALRTPLNFNRIEAGEKLFIDLMPPSWSGMPPALPQEIIDELAERARMAAIRAERERKAAEMASLQPKASIRVGRNPTFMRVQFDWTQPTKAQFVQEGETGRIMFEWPVGIDTRELTMDLPPEIASIESAVTPDGAKVTLQLAKGVRPRFYENNPRQYVLDVDIKGSGLPAFELANLADGAAPAGVQLAVGETPEPRVDMLKSQPEAKTVTPFVSVLGSTVRVVFPFEQDTPAAVFRRGDTVWMIFDTVSGIAVPNQSEALNALTSEFAVAAAGDTQVVRVELSKDRLATLGSEGMAWVLSLGDIMLGPTEPIELSRRRDAAGDFEVVADVARPARIHDFRDPIVGDMLKVVTAYPPARGVTRTLDYVDFSALRSVHGLVLKPRSDDLDVALENTLAVVTTPGGLIVSAQDSPRALNAAQAEAARGSYVDLAALETNDPGIFTKRRDEMMTAAAVAADGADLDRARLTLAQYYNANQFGLEALGTLRVLQAELTDKSLERKVRINMAIANTMAGRASDALGILNLPTMTQDIDGLIWRTIARAESYDFKGAKLDAVDALGIIDSYPDWVRNRFYFAAVRAGVETDDASLAERMLSKIAFSRLDPEQVTLYHLLSGRIDEARGRNDEAIDIYGQVIAADIRPTRAEAVYRTLRLLDQAGRLDLDKASQTLAVEAMLWRGNPLEADMQKLVAELYFRNGAYRQGFETVRQAVSTYPESPPINALRDEAAAQFGELFLDGVADSLGPIDALSLYYDFRELTPPGGRGDEMIRNLARRLVRVDLLPQAAELLEYQINSRLRGVARTQVAADLAVIYLADRKPQDALRVLNATRLPDLPETLNRQRRVLEARAMIDGGREQLGLDMLRDLDGRDVALMRIDANWKGRRYTQAGEMLEGLYANETGALSQPARMNIIKAAVGYVLANDTFGLSRLRAKFADRMVTSPEWPMFDLVTGQIEVTSREFKAVANQVSGVDGINAFLSAYRETYGNNDALAPLVASEVKSGDVASR